MVETHQDPGASNWIHPDGSRDIGQINLDTWDMLKMFDFETRPWRLWTLNKSCITSRRWRRNNEESGDKKLGILLNFIGAAKLIPWNIGRHFRDTYGDLPQYYDTSDEDDNM